MTISKERFEAICFEAADEINENGGGYIFKQDAEAFGLALIKRVEAESEVKGWMLEDGTVYEVEQHSLFKMCVIPNQTKLIALPLVSEE